MSLFRFGFSKRQKLNKNRVQEVDDGVENHSDDSEYEYEKSTAHDEPKSVGTTVDYIAQNSCNTNVRPAAESTGHESDDVASDAAVLKSKTGNDKKGGRSKPAKLRKFQTSWTKQYPWVVYHPLGNIMHCKTCLKFPRLADPENNSFYAGSQLFHLNALQCHNKSENHRRCIDAEKVQHAPEKAPLHAAFRRMDEEQNQKMRFLFNTAYYVAKRERPYKEFEHLCELQIKNGVDLGQTYFNAHACQTFINYEAQVIKDQLREQLKKADFFSIMSDTSTDVSNIEQEIVYVRLIENGKVYNKMLSLVSLESANALGILKSIDEAFSNLDVCPDSWRQKVICLGTDGASVMLGRHGGVAALLKQEVPHLVAFHCVAHRLELAILDAIKDEPCIQEIKRVLQGIYRFYNNSPKALRELDQVAEALEMSVLKPNTILGTRWVAHMVKALENMLRNFKALALYFEDVKAGRKGTPTMAGLASSLLSFMKSKRKMTFAFWLLDVLIEISRLSFHFQRDDSSITSIQNSVEATRLAIKTLAAEPGKNLKSFKDEVQVHNHDDEDESGSNEVRYMYRLVVLGNHPGDEESLQNTKTRVVDGVMNALNKRFEDLSSGFLDACKIFEPSNWPDDADLLGTYGRDELQVVMSHFSKVLEQKTFDDGEIWHEWLTFKVHVNGHLRLLSSQTLWQRLLVEFRGRYPNLVMLIEIMLLVPTNTACCERGFSAMKRVKSDWRGSLQTSSLDALLRITIDGPSVKDFNSEVACNLWWSSGKRIRRPDFERAGEKASKVLLIENEH